MVVRTAGEAPRTITAADVPVLALRDLWDGARHYEMWISFAYHDIRQRFRRSALGPLWITLTMGIMVGALALVFGSIFGQSISQTLPYISVGLIFWGLFSSCVNEGTTVFINSAGYIRSVTIPLSVHVYRMLAKNVIIWAFNMVIYVVVFFAFSQSLTLNHLLFFPAFVLFMVNVAWISLVVAILSTRFRDIPQVITNLLQVVFFVTPIFWSPESLPTRPAFVAYNPLDYLIEIVRAPLLGTAPTPLAWLVVSIMAVLGLVVAALLYRRSYGRIPYWV